MAWYVRKPRLHIGPVYYRPSRRKQSTTSALVWAVTIVAFLVALLIALI